MTAGFEVFAPGSLCLFGERDAPYGSAILLAIDRGARARVTPRPGSRKLEVELPQFGLSLAVAAASLLVVAELIQRGLFFAAAVGPRMPGVSHP